MKTPPLGAEGKAMWSAVLADPSNGLAKVALADWLDERGRFVAVAVGLRWCGRKGAHPLRFHSPHATRVYWYGVHRNSRRPACYDLPRPLFAALRGAANNGHSLPYTGEWVAFRELGQVLITLTAAIA